MSGPVADGGGEAHFQPRPEIIDMKTYKVVIDGIEHEMQLNDDDAKRLGVKAGKPRGDVDAETKARAAGTVQNKARDTTQK